MTYITKLLMTALEGCHLIPASVLLLFALSELKYIYTSRIWQIQSIKLPPIRNLTQPTELEENSKDITTFSIAHLSDLHLTSTPDCIRIDGRGRGGNQVLTSLISNYQHELLDVDAIVITGDVTDRGDSREWKCFYELFPNSVLRKVILVPGNHDFNMAFCLGVDWDKKARMIKQIRWLLATNLVQGERSSIIHANGDLILFRSYIHEVMPLIKQFVEHPPRVKYDQWGSYVRSYGYKLINRMKEIVSEIFPLVVKIGDGSNYVIVIDSNDMASNIASNAFGRISDGQLERLKLFLASASEPPVAIAMHHHMVPTSRGKGILKRLYQAPLGLVNAEPLIRILDRIPHCVVLSGHQHRYNASMVGIHCSTISAPSIIVDGEVKTVNDMNPCMGIYTVKWCKTLGSLVTGENWLPCA